MFFHSTFFLDIISAIPYRIATKFAHRFDVGSSLKT